MPMIKLSRPDTCYDCGAQLPVGTRAFYWRPRGQRGRVSGRDGCHDPQHRRESDHQQQTQQTQQNSVTPQDQAFAAALVTALQSLGLPVPKELTCQPDAKAESSTVVPMAAPIPALLTEPEKSSAATATSALPAALSALPADTSPTASDTPTAPDPQPPKHTPRVKTRSAKPSPRSTPSRKTEPAKVVIEQLTDFDTPVNSMPEGELCARVRAANLRAALVQAKKICNKTNIPILSHARLRRAGGYLMLDVTNLEVSLIQAVPLLETTETSDGAICVNVERFAKVLAGCKGEITLRQTDAGQLTLERQGRARTMLRGLPAENFPTLPTVDDPPSVGIFDGRPFLDAVKRIVPAVSSADSRFQLSGALFEPDPETGKTLHIVATDGHRLHHDVVPWGGPRGENTAHESHLVPRLALALLANLPAALCPETLRWTHSDYHGRVYGPRWCITYRILEGTFPDWRRVINPPGDLIEPPRKKGGKPTTTPELALTVDSAELAATVKAVLATTGNRARAVRVVLNGRVELSACDPDTGESSASCDVIDSNGRELTIGLNPDYLLDVCQVAPTSIKWSAWSPNDQTVYRSDTFEAVVMPTRL